jgi:thiamine-phosphate pyrophosphorylase
MSLGEKGADYLAFGIPPHINDRETAKSRQRDLVAWWSEIFEPPCMACDVETPEEARDLVEAGADFICFRISEEVPLATLRSWVRDLDAAVSSSAPVA